MSQTRPGKTAKGDVPPDSYAGIAAATKTPGTSTSTGGATAHRNTGAATGGAVTITMSGSSSTETATTTGAGAGAGKGKGKDKGDGKGEKPSVTNITVNSTGKSGDAVDSSKGKATKGSDSVKGIDKATKRK